MFFKMNIYTYFFNKNSFDFCFVKAKSMKPSGAALFSRFPSNNHINTGLTRKALTE
jgi:hypothetical protein